MGLKKTELRKPDDSLFWPSFVAPIPMRLRREIQEALEKEAAEKARKSRAKSRRPSPNQ